MNKKRIGTLLIVIIGLVCMLLSACSNTDKIKGTWQIDGVYYSERGEIENLEQLRESGDKTKITLIFDGQGAYEAEFTDSKGNTESFSGSYKLPEEGHALTLDENRDDDKLTILFYPRFATFENKNDRFVLVTKEDTANDSEINEKMYLLREVD